MPPGDHCEVTALGFVVIALRSIQHEREYGTWCVRFRPCGLALPDEARAEIRFRTAIFCCDERRQRLALTQRVELHGRPHDAIVVRPYHAGDETFTAAVHGLGAAANTH